MNSFKSNDSTKLSLFFPHPVQLSHLQTKRPIPMLTMLTNLVGGFSTFRKFENCLERLDLNAERPTRYRKAFSVSVCKLRKQTIGHELLRSTSSKIRSIGHSSDGRPGTFLSMLCSECFESDFVKHFCYC